MAINEDIYGDSTEWADYWHGMCKCTDYTLWSKVESGDWELNELIDNSVCYFGAIGNFYGANPIAFLPDNEQCRVFEEQEVSNMLFLLQDSSSTEGWKYDYFGITGTINKWSEWNNISDMPNYSPQALIKTMFNFKLNKLLFIPYVRASTTDEVVPSSSEFFTLGDWIANTHSTYPYLCTVYMIPYYNYGTDESPEWVSASVDTDHYIFTQRNAFFSEEFKNVGDGDVTATYYFGGVPTKRQHIMIMGFRDSWFEIATEKPIGFDPDPSHYKFNNDFTRVRYCREYSEDLVKEIYSQIAFYGVFFLGSGADSFYTVSLISDRVYLGTIEEGGYTKGNYTHGEANADQPQFSWADTSESEYDPSVTPKIDPNNYNVPMKNNYPWISSPNRLYSINSTNVSTIIGLYNALWQCYYTNNVGTGENQKPPTEFNYDEFLTISPIDTIISLKLFPYDTKEGTTPVGVRLGRYQAGINAYPAKKFEILDFGTVDIFAYFGVGIEGDWRDRETKYTLYAPFCGTMELDPAFYMGKRIGLQYWIDQITGACTAALYMNDSRGVQIFPDTISGVCAVDVPITGLDQATIQSQIFNANQQLKIANVNAATGIMNSVLSVGAAAAKGDALSGATSFFGGIGNFIKSNAGVESAQYNLTHNKTAPRQIGSASPLSAMLGDWTPRIIISKPVDPLSKTSFKTFSETKGVACIIPDTIGSRKGFIQMQNVKLQAPEAATAAMTQTEAEMIKSLLSSGIFIK